MDTRVLVAPPLDKARQLIGAIDDRLNVTAAFWVFWSPLATWRLYLAVSEVRTRGPHAVYDVIEDSLKQIGSADGLSPRDIYVLSPHDSLVHAVRGAVGQPVIDGEIRLPQLEVGDQEYDNVIVLRSFGSTEEAFAAAVLERLAVELSGRQGHVVREPSFRTPSGRLGRADGLAIFHNTHLLVECKSLNQNGERSRRLRESVERLSQMLQSYSQTLAGQARGATVRGVLVVPADVQTWEVRDPNVRLMKFDLARREFVEPGLDSVLAT